MQATRPTTDQIKAKSEELAKAIGSAVQLRASDVAFALDVAFPAMTKEQFADVQAECGTVVCQLRSAALKTMWEAA